MRIESARNIEVNFRCKKIYMSVRSCKFVTDRNPCIICVAAFGTKYE